MQQASHGGSAGHPHADHTGEHAGPGAPGPRAPGLRDVQRGVSNGWEVREWTVSSPSAVALSGPSEDPTGSGRGAGGRLQTSLGQWWLRSCRAHENRPGGRNTLPAAPGVSLGGQDGARGHAQPARSQVRPPLLLWRVPVSGLR